MLFPSRQVKSLIAVTDVLGTRCVTGLGCFYFWEELHHHTSLPPLAAADTPQNC